MGKLIFLVLFFSAGVSFAQKFEMGLNGGMSYNTMSVPATSYNVEKQFYIIGLRGMLVNRKFSYGISVDFRQRAGRWFPGQATVTPGYFSYHGDPMSSIKFSEQNIPVKLFVNRRFCYHQFEMYTGVASGYSFNEHRSVTYFVGDMPAEYKTSRSGNLIIGLQTGCSWFITKQLGLNVEVSAEYAPKLPREATFTVHTFSFPATIGVRYKL